jgi:acyl-CoA synthetase (AMP-forming)/AMP-acid ligase II
VQAVICGAEPIRAESMKGFFEYFAPCGFNPLSFNPSYGLAEFTLCATSQVCIAHILDHLCLSCHVLTSMESCAAVIDAIGRGPASP